jgi:diguanylate cyclase (GGDEF)-like protein
MSEILPNPPTQSSESMSDTQIRLMNNSDIQIKALSEYIGRNTLAKQILQQVDASSLDGTGLLESSLPLYSIDTRKPLTEDEVTEQRDEIIKQKKIEPMTGAYRREELYAQYPNGFSDGETVLAVDVAGLKLLNDFYGGHKTGDVALKSAVLSIKNLFPKSDIFRTGGDEFVVVTTEEIGEEVWNRVNEEYLATLNGSTDGQVITDKETLLRAGISTSNQLKGSDSARPSTDDVVAAADEAEVKISALLKILGHDKNVPRIASSEEIDTWLKDNKIELVEKDGEIVAYRTWGPGGRKALPKYLRKKGSTRVRGR